MKEKDQENAYQCQNCSTLPPGATISYRPDLGPQYCSQCNSEALRLFTLEQAVDDAVDQGCWQDRQTV